MWTDEELNILKSNRKKAISTLAFLLDKHSISDIKERLALLKPLQKRNKWTDEDIEILKQNYAKMGYAVVELLQQKRSRVNVCKKAKEFGLKRISQFTEEEIEILKDYYPILGIKTKYMLPGRTERSIDNAAKRHKIKRIKNTKKISRNLDWENIKNLGQVAFLDTVKNSINPELSWRNFAKILKINMLTLEKWRYKNDSKYQQHMPDSMRRLLYLEIKYGIQEND